MKKDHFIWALALIGAVTGVVSLVYITVIRDFAITANQEFTGPTNLPLAAKENHGTKRGIENPGKINEEPLTEINREKSAIGETENGGETVYTTENIHAAWKKAEEIVSRATPNIYIHDDIDCKDEKILEMTKNKIKNIIKQIGNLNEHELNKCTLSSLGYYRYKNYNWAKMNDYISSNRSVEYFSKARKAEKEHLLRIAVCLDEDNKWKWLKLCCMDLHYRENPDKLPKDWRFVGE